MTKKPFRNDESPETKEPPHSDEPTGKDGLKRSHYAEAFARLAEKCDTPLVIGLYGTWGIGKTSLMKLIEDKLDAKTTLTIWFNPWQHQFDENPVLGLAQALADNVDTKGKTEVKKLLTLIAAAFGSRILEFTTGLKLLELLKLGRIYEEERFQVREAQLLLRRHFEKLVKVAKGDSEQKKRLVIFIDDLDRCMPDETLKMLEALKLYLNIEDCVYFLGVDRSVLEQSIKRRYDEHEIKGIDYLEKIVQLPFVIPPIAKDAMKEFISQLLPEGLKSCQRLLVTGLGDNPRQVKRFINILTLNHQLAVDISPYDPEILAVLLLIQYRSPGLYRRIAKDASLLRMLTLETDEMKSIREEYLDKEEGLYKIISDTNISEKAPLKEYVELTSAASVSEDVESSRSEIDLEDILSKHVLWLNSGGKKGERADLREMDLTGIDLIGKNLHRADLRGTNLMRANLSGGTNLSGGANLSSARLNAANLTMANLHTANLQEADLSNANLNQANMIWANLLKTNLNGASLRGAKLGHARLTESDLIGADFGFASLKGAKGLTVDQLCRVKTLHRALLDEDLVEQIEEKCRHLL